MKHYKVIETTDYNEPLNEWVTIAEGFTDEALAIEFAEIHYDTQVSDHNYYNPTNDCKCESCIGGWRVMDYKELCVQVVEVTAHN